MYYIGLITSIINKLNNPLYVTYKNIRDWCSKSYLNLSLLWRFRIFSLDKSKMPNSFYHIYGSDAKFKAVDGYLQTTEKSVLTLKIQEK